MKKLLLSALGACALLSVQAQSRTEKVLFTTGGNYGAANNQVQLCTLDPTSYEVDTIQSFPGDFSNAIYRVGTQAFVHVGRAFGHPAGGDALVRVDIPTGNIIDSTQTGVSGLQKIYSNENIVAFNCGFGATGSYFVAVDANDLSNVLFQDTVITENTTGLAYYNNQLFTTFTQNDSGKVAVFDINSTVEFNRVISLDTLSSNIGSAVVTENGYLVATNTKYDAMYNVLYTGVSAVELNTDSYVSDTSLYGGSLFAVDGNSVLGDFGGGLDWYDLNTGTITNWASLYPSAYVLDTLHDWSYIQNTDFFSYGNVQQLNENGSILNTFTTDISGSAIDLVYNRPPYQNWISEYHTYGVADTFVIDAVDSDWMDVISFNNPTTLSGATSATLLDSAVIYNPGSFSGLDTISIEACDAFGFCSTVHIAINAFPLGINDVEQNAITIYPNPTKDVVNFSQTVDLVRVYDLSGKLQREAQQVKNMNLSALPKGMYIIQVSSEGSTQTDKIIVE